MSAWLADVIFRFRYPLTAVILVGFVALIPKVNFTEIDNDISIWISKDDPVHQTYERFRQEFGGQRTLIIALKSERLFTPEALAFVRQITEDIERVDYVQRVTSLATANIVRTLDEPASASAAASADKQAGPHDPADEGGIEVQPLLDERIEDPAGAARVRETVLDDPLLRGDLVSEDGTV